jgi:excisionase family DNA binding protein
MPTDHLSVDDAAAELGVTKGTIWKWIRRYELPTFRFLGDRKTYLRRADVDRLREPMPIEEAKKLAA